MSFSSRRMVVSSGSSRDRSAATRRRTQASSMSARALARLDLYLTSLLTGGRLAWRGRCGRGRTARRAGGPAEARAEQVAQAPPLLGVGVGQREGAAAQEAGDLAGVDAIVL